MLVTPQSENEVTEHWMATAKLYDRHDAFSLQGKGNCFARYRSTHIPFLL